MAAVVEAAWAWAWGVGVLTWSILAGAGGGGASNQGERKERAQRVIVESRLSPAVGGEV
tara:strand:- start:14199 stop:14375 length:177 start_codon:yes stop_codon:yes gene_type:complete